MKTNEIKTLCMAEEGKTAVLQGNIAFAVGCVRCGIHGADGYPGTPSTEVIDRGLSQVQDMIKVAWSTNEAVSTGVGLGYSLAGHDCVVTMKIPGLFQAGDIFSSSAFYTEKRGALVYFIASDFVPSSTQHVVDPRYFFKSCMVPVFEPRSHQEMLEASGIAAAIGRKYRTPAVIFASGNLCHSEGLVRLNSIKKVEPTGIPEDLKKFNTLPTIARANYDKVLTERMPELRKMVEGSVLNEWIKGSGKKGVITYGANVSFVKEVRELYKEDFDILSIAFTNPLPLDLLKKFCEAIKEEVYVIEDGYRFVQERMMQMGLEVKGKDEFSEVTEWSPATVAERMGFKVKKKTFSLAPVPRPPMICAGCPYRLFAEVIKKMRKQRKIQAVFGDIGCNALLYFMDALDTGIAMGASDSKRQGFVTARPELSSKCISILGDSTECHTGMDATRNAVFNNVPGVKVVLDNYWTAMTGGQPAPSSPVNLKGEKIKFNLVKALEGNGCDVLVANAYDRTEIRKTMNNAMKKAEQGDFCCVVVQGSCIKKVPNSKKSINLKIDKEKCDQCYMCMICPGIEKGEDGFPRFNNLCTGCGGEKSACMQMCPFDAMVPLEEDERASVTADKFDIPPEIERLEYDNKDFPKRLTVAIRGVGGQGNLFFGRVLTQLAFLAGYEEKNIVKGETHGMAQMGGPVVSTFSCGDVHSPVLFPSSADCLVSMEASELLRPGFLELLKENGTVLSASTVVVPPNVSVEDYPAMDAIRKELKDYKVIEIDVLGKSLELGDTTGRSANVVMMGALSKIPPFDGFPEGIWLQAIRNVSPKDTVWAANYAAFQAGRELV
ncbi:MAG: 2-oxoacid:acceptor oxidoreductase family protein [Deltaproteobacteria bacterium]|nr:2-oxoacid:acceptor oxidoreductase family protein [Deltaproteobacteria bacterium]